jgi:YgiT-type zinc finger domain-containing protein
MICSNCGSNSTKIIYTNKVYGKKRNMVLIENVPVEFCKNCGIRLLSNNTMKRIEEILAEARSKNYYLTIKGAKFTEKEQK